MAAANSDVSAGLPRAITYLVAVTALGILSPPVLAQGGPAPQGFDLRYETLLRGADQNKPTPGNEFGDQHSLESGGLSFNIVDVTVPGNNDLAVEFRRVLNLSDPRKKTSATTYGYPMSAIADWSLGIAKIQATYDAQAGWITTEPGRSRNNCSISQRQYMTPPPGAYAPNSFSPSMFWDPPTARFPDGSSRLLVYNESLMPMPSTGGPYYWVTSDHDVVSCIPTIKNSNQASTDPLERRLGGGEGYLLVRADGTKYWFDWMALEYRLPSFSTTAQNQCSWSCQVVTGVVFLEQAVMALYPSRVEDRYGNWVTYTYSNKAHERAKIDRIESSDGRLIEIGYSDGRISSVSSHGRTWGYSYGMSQGNSPYAMLAEVINPDNSKWIYSGDSHPIVIWPYPTTGPEGRCQQLNWTQYVNPDSTTDGITDFGGFSVTNPAGATAVFRMQSAMLGKSGGPRMCHETGRVAWSGLSYQVTNPSYPLGGFNPVLTGKRISGPGIPTYVWKYHYQSDIGFHPVVGNSRTKVLNPDGSYDDYVFGNTVNGNDGLLLSHVKRNVFGVLSQETISYAVPWSSQPGFVEAPRVGAHARGEGRTGDVFLRSMIRSEKFQQGTRFIWEVSRNCGSGGVDICLDARGRPLVVSKMSVSPP